MLYGCLCDVFFFTHCISLTLLTSSRTISLERPPREYEKPWMRRRRIADEKIYRSKKKGVDELLNYLKFVRDAKEAREEEWAFSESDEQE